MKNVLIYGSYKAPNRPDLYTDALGNHYVILLDSVNDEQALPFIATVKDEATNVDDITAQEIVMTYKDIDALRRHLIAQTNLDRLSSIF